MPGNSHTAHSTDWSQGHYPVRFPTVLCKWAGQHEQTSSILTSGRHPSCMSYSTASTQRRDYEHQQKTLAVLNAHEFQQTMCMKFAKCSKIIHRQPIYVYLLLTENQCMMTSLTWVLCTCNAGYSKNWQVRMQSAASSWSSLMEPL